jgi:hypothetical protein
MSKSSSVGGAPGEPLFLLLSWDRRVIADEMRIDIRARSFETGLRTSSG